MQQVETPLDQKVQTAISASPYLFCRKLRFEAESGRVILQGVVSSYFQKQMAQEAVRRIDGVEEIQNDLEVAWS